MLAVYIIRGGQISKVLEYYGWGRGGEGRMSRRRKAEKGAGRIEKRKKGLGGGVGGGADWETS